MNKNCRYALQKCQCDRKIRRDICEEIDQFTPCTSEFDFRMLYNTTELAYFLFWDCEMRVASDCDFIVSWRKRNFDVCFVRLKISLRRSVIEPSDCRNREKEAFACMLTSPCPSHQSH